MTGSDDVLLVHGGTPLEGEIDPQVPGCRDHGGRCQDAERGGDPAGVSVRAPNAVGNFCFDVTLSYRRLERPGRSGGG